MFGPLWTFSSVRPSSLGDFCWLWSSNSERVRKGTCGTLALRRRVYLASSAAPAPSPASLSGAESEPQ